MRVAIATHKGFYLALLDLDALEVEALDRVYEGYFYGTDQHADGRLFAGERAHGWSPNKDSPTILHQFLPDGQVGNSALISEIEDIHQLTFDGETAYICDTGHDRLLKNFDGFWRASDRGEDRHHLNSVSIANDKVFVALHNHGAEPSEIVVLDKESADELDRIPLPHGQIHNIEPLANGNLVYNASNDGQVIEIDRSGEVQNLWVVGRHPKGMIVTDEFIIVGCSEHAVRTKRRFIADSELVFISREYGCVIGRPSLRDQNDPIGNVNEIRTVEEDVPITRDE